MGWNPLKKSSWKELGDKVLGTGDKIEDVFNEVIEDAKKQIIDVKDDVRDNVHRQWKAVEKHVEDQAKHVIQETNKTGAHIGRALDKKKDEINRDITKVRKDAESSLKHVGEEIEKGLKKAFNAGVPDILLKTALPTSISISGQVVGNGITISYEESEEAVDEVMKAIRSGKFDVDIMYHVIPDSITIEVGVELALVISVDVGASITYNSQEDIKLIVDWFKKNV